MTIRTGLILLGICTLAAAEPTLVDLRLRNAPLLTLLDRIASQCDSGLAIAPGLNDEVAKVVTIDVRDVSWADALAFFRDQHGMRLVLEGGRLMVQEYSQSERSRLVLRRHDVRHLLDGVPFFPGPSLSVPEPGGMGAQLIPEIAAEDNVELGDIQDLLMSAIAREHWDIDGAGMEEWDGHLVVIQVPEVQERIAALLRELELRAGRGLAVRIWELPVGTATSAVLDAAAWHARAATLAGPTACFVQSDGSRQHHFSGVQEPYLADHDVVGTAYDPILTVRSAGLMLDCESRVTRAGVLMTLRFAHNAVTRSEERPITVGGQQLGGLQEWDNALSLQEDTRLIPSGGAALIADRDRAWAISVEVLELPSEP